MISNPLNGWCDFKLGTFTGMPSYITDVPCDLLDAFISYHKTGSGVAYFDEEGTGFTLVLTPASIFIISEKEKTELYDFSDMSIKDIEIELLEDIKYNINQWVNFTVAFTKDEFIKYEKQIQEKIKTLSKLVGGTL